jgi:hypothetical protein
MRRDDTDITWLMRLSTRLFQMLLILYPRDFRREYGREMTLVFRDTCRQTSRCHGAAGILELWLTTLLDLFSTALVERLAEVNHMSSTVLFTRISGMVAAVGGLLLLILVYVEFILGGARFTLGYLIPIYGVCIAIGIAGFYILSQYELAGRIGLGLAFLGGLVVSLGLTLLIILDRDGGWTTWMIGMVLYQVGLAVFGWSAFKHKPLPRWNSLPLLVGGLTLAIYILAMVFGSEGNEIFFFLWLLANGLGWIGLGVLIMLGDKRTAYHTGAAA